MDMSNLASGILADLGENVIYTSGGGDPVTVDAVVTRFGLGPCPTGWPADLFPNTAKHASLRISPADVVDEPTGDDIITMDGLSYEVRAVQREPKTGQALWWVLLCAADQRGRYR